MGQASKYTKYFFSNLSKGSSKPISFRARYFSPFIAAFRKQHSAKHILILVVEVWREQFDNNYIGAISIGLSKAFHSLPHDLNIAKLAAYGLDNTALKLIFSYLMNGKQCVRINNTYSDFILGVPQGSIVSPLLFNFSVNDLFSFIESVIISLIMIHILLGQTQFLIW